MVEKASESKEAAGRPAPAMLPAQLLDAFPVSAASFVVTLYGDVAAPRGGELWTGNIIETLATLGIAESRVRTALSRLVAAGRLEGAKSGRRSYYRLTPAAEAEFESAARLIYGPVEPAPLRGWHLVALTEGEREAATAVLLRRRFGLAAPHLAILPDRGAPLAPLPGCRFAATTVDDLGPLLAGAWPLEALAARMRSFIDRFEAFEAGELAPAGILGLRLLLVHVFRDLALRDPLLPSALLPPDWPGRAARTLFARLYRALSPGAEAVIAARFRNRAGPLPLDRRRLQRRFHQAA
jgi:phenylacetic acid degradation operon negative regulatory protein